MVQATYKQSSNWMAANNSGREGDHHMFQQIRPSVVEPDLQTRAGSVGASRISVPNSSPLNGTERRSCNGRMPLAFTPEHLLVCNYCEHVAVDSTHSTTSKEHLIPSSGSYRGSAPTFYILDLREHPDAGRPVAPIPSLLTTLSSS